jgi:hypothetical protein
MQGFAAPFNILNPNIGGLLAMYQMRIPELQRPYAWKVPQAEELVKDLQRLLKAVDDGVQGPQHFFGTLVVISRAGKPDEIIDGQQRITTVSLLLGLLEQALLSTSARCAALARLEEDSVRRQLLNNLAAASERRATIVHNLLWVHDGYDDGGAMRETPRLTVSPEIRVAYVSLISGDYSRNSVSEPSPVRNLRAVADFLNRELIHLDSNDALAVEHQLDHIERVLRVVEQGLVVVRLSTTSANAGYELFESLNARGISLNALDHLKVWMLALYAEFGADDSMIADAMRTMAGGEIEQQVRFFEDFYAARSRRTEKHDGINRPKALVKAAREHVFKEDSETPTMTVVGTIESEVSLMVELTPIWFRLKKHDGSGFRRPPLLDVHPLKDWINNRLELLLGTLQHQAAYPFLMVAAERIGGDGDTFADLVHDLEKFFFRYRTICGVNERKIVLLYNQFLEHLESSPGFDLGWIRGRLSSALVQDAPIARFKELLPQKLDYRKQPAHSRIRYFFEMIDNYSYARKPNRRAGALNLPDWWIEHIFPQNPVVAQGSLSEEDLHCLGNLCLLPPEVNNKLSNFDFKSKQAEAERLRQLPGAERIVIGLPDSEDIFYHHKGNTWATADIQKRLQKLQDFAAQIFTI